MDVEGLAECEVSQQFRRSRIDPDRHDDDLEHRIAAGQVEHGRTAAGRRAQAIEAVVLPGPLGGEDRALPAGHDQQVRGNLLTIVRGNGPQGRGVLQRHRGLELRQVGDQAGLLGQLHAQALSILLDERAGLVESARQVPLGL